MFPRSARRSLKDRVEEFFRGAIARWLIRRYVRRGKKLTEPTLTPTQQIDALQRQIAALRAMQTANPNVSLADQLASLNTQPALVTPALVEHVAAQAAAPVVPIPVVHPAVTETTAIEPLPQLEPEPAMETPAQPASTAVAPVASTAPPAASTPPSTGSALPDVKMLAPILKIALATLSIEQMVEIGLHIKMGAPGFHQFLESDVAKVKFRELYAAYCAFLATPPK